MDDTDIEVLVPTVCTNRSVASTRSRCLLVCRPCISETKALEGVEDWLDEESRQQIILFLYVRLTAVRCDVGAPHSHAMIGIKGTYHIIEALPYNRLRYIGGHFDILTYDFFLLATQGAGLQQRRRNYCFFNFQSAQSTIPQIPPDVMSDLGRI